MTNMGIRHRFTNSFDHDCLRRCRKSRMLLLKDVAEATGISVPYLSDIERGRTTPSIKTLLKLANYYKLHAGNWFVYEV